MRYLIFLALTLAGPAYAAKPTHGYSDLVRCAAYMRIAVSSQEQDGFDEDAAYSKSLGAKLQRRAEVAAAKSGKSKDHVEVDIMAAKVDMLTKMIELDGRAQDALVSEIENGCTDVIGMD